MLTLVQKSWITPKNLIGVFDRVSIGLEEDVVQVFGFFFNAEAFRDIAGYVEHLEGDFLGEGAVGELHEAHDLCSI